MEKQPKAHDCRKNHGTLSKAMEPASGVELFIRASDKSVKFSVYRVMMTHDDDDEVHIREKVTYELEKTLTLYIWKDESKRNKMKWIEESWMRGQQICPLTIHFNMWTVSSDVSIQRRHWQQLSVHLWAYSTHPTHDVNDVWRLTTTPGSTSPSLFEQWCRFFYVPQEPDRCKCCETGSTRKSNRPQMSLQRQHFLLSYLKTLSVGPAGVRTRDLPLSRPALSQLS